MESMTSPNSEPPRHSRDFDLGYGGDEHNPSTGPIPAAEPNDSPAGAVNETQVLPALLDESAQPRSAADLQPLEREALGASGGQVDPAAEADRAAPVAPAEPAQQPQEPVWPAARLGENFGPHGSADASPPAPAAESPWVSGPAQAPQIPAQQIPTAPPQRESTWRPAADAHHHQGRPGTPPALGGGPYPREMQAPWPPMSPQGPVAPTAGLPAGNFGPFGAAPHTGAAGYQPSAGAPTEWGPGGQPPQQPPRFASDPYAPSMSPTTPAMGPPIQPPPIQPQDPPPGARAAAAAAQRRSVAESLSNLDSAPGRVRMSEAQWGATLNTPKRPTPETGWRAALYKASFHLINPGRSQKEKDLAEWVSTIQSPLRGRYRIAIISVRGGVGKTTTATGTACAFAKYRLEDRTIAVDADPGYGSLADRIDPDASGSLLTVLDSGNRGVLVSDDQIRAHVGANTLGLMVLAGDTRLTNRPQLTPEIFRHAMPHVEKFYRVIFVDCGLEIDHPVMPAVLDNVDALIVVSSTKTDGAKGAGVTLDWLTENHYHELLKNTIVVINDLKGNSAKKIRNKIKEKFGEQVDDVFIVPFDKHLDEATVVDFKNGLKRKTRRKFVEIAASIANNFASTTDLSHD